MTCHRTFICILDCLTADFRSSYDAQLHHGVGNGSRRWLERRGFISRPFLILMMLAVGMITLHAAPDPPVEVIINPYTLLFSGNQSAGIKDEHNNIARILEVRDLTSTIQPASGEFGILWSSNSGADMTLNSGGVWTESGGFVLGQQVKIITTGLDAAHWGGGIYVAAEANGSVTINSNSAITTHGVTGISGVYARGIYALGQGVQGSGGSNAGAFGDSSRGDPGAIGGNITIDARGNIDTRDSQSIGIFALSAGGRGGDGGDGGTLHDGSRGGDGGAGGKVVVKGDAGIVTNGAQSFGILAVSAGGDAGPGGSGHVFSGGGQGADGGVGGEVLVNGTWNITTHGDDSHGIWAKSNGGSGSDGGGSGFIAGSSGSGGVGTPGGTVNVTSGGQIITDGISAYGIFAESIGGFGGGGGSSGVFVSSSGDGSSGGAGGAVTVVTLVGSSIETYGTGSSHGILAQSVGGGGGTGAGAAALFSANGGDGAPGGSGGNVSVINAGKITTARTGAMGIYAQSIGGGGGDGGDAVGISSIGGSGGKVFLSSGGEVNVANTGNIRTQSNAIFAQSVGGGGGNGGASSGWFSMGGKAGGGGDGGAVTVTSVGEYLQSYDDGAAALFAQSLGGGGGNGGSSVATGVFGAVAIGGSGGDGGKGGDVKVGVNPDNRPDPVTGYVTTAGNFANGIHAQSIGGGGGNGGYATSVAVGIGGAESLALGGVGEGGGSAGDVRVFFGDARSSIITQGENSNGIFAQSVGGGGGNGGMSLSLAAADEYSVSLSMGGQGGNGGKGGDVIVGLSDTPLLGTIKTNGEHSYGILAQSVGGGGGNGGMSIAGSLSGTGGAALSFGGNGGAGNTGGDVSVFSHNTIITKGANSHGVFAQSVGGGGGSGGSSISGSLTGGAAIDLSFGGNGDSGGNSGKVTVRTGEQLNPGSITTEGWRSYGVLAQSIGGGGGDGGYSIGGGISGGPAITAAIGGTAGGGGDADKVDMRNFSEIRTTGDDSIGLLAQSLGGNGGNGGFSVGGSITTSGAVTMGVGGNGGGGGNGKDVILRNSGLILYTSGNNADGILAQSVGGGGGNGGFSTTGSITGGPSLGMTVGGSGDAGGNGGTVNVDYEPGGYVQTVGSNSSGVVAQSIGGGGGNGGFSVGLSLSTETAGNFAIGGHGAAGGTGGNVTLKSKASIETGLYGQDSQSGAFSNGLFAQSIGGGGGNGGFTVGGSLTGGEALNLSIGGSGSSGGTGGNIDLTNSGYIRTRGPSAFGILAQSIGGGGGNGGFSVGASGGLGVDATSLTASIGGTGGSGGNAGVVKVTNNDSITSFGDNSTAIFAQSVGGGGGNGGFSFAGSVGGSPGHSLSASVGGRGREGGIGGSVDVLGALTSIQVITTYGAQSHGILAQSIGGGGGNGGFSASASAGTAGPGGSTTSVSVSVGGVGGSGNAGGAVNIGTSSLPFTGNIETNGADSTGIFAQSIGGGGGNGGFSVSGAVNFSTSDDGLSNAVSLSVGGSGGTGNSGGTVGVNHSGAIETSGDGSYGIHAQSIGGGGGNGGSARGFTLTAGAADSGDRYRTLALSIGGYGSESGSGGAVTVNNVGDVTTQGGDAYGIFAQSIGGGGGNGGDAHFGIPSVTLPPNLDRTKSPKKIQLGGTGGSSGDGGAVNITLQGNVKTKGDGAYGVFAQSIGGGGGAGGNGVDKATISLGGGTGSGGNGGNISISMMVGNGSIDTQGNGAHGIFAQSIGGGGGAAGSTGDSADNSLKNKITHYADVIGETLASAGGAGGNGGNVMISSRSVITTEGADSAGIFAQSIGGGGGVAGSVGLNGLNFAGSVGGAGSGGTVDIYHKGSVITNGARSDGIFAQSAGGAGSGGVVKVRVEADILANGADSNGIYAQSSGGDNGSDIAVTIFSGTIQGGSGNGAAVRFVDGKDNTLENSGFIISLAGPSGISISGGSGNETVNNSGVIKGSVDLGDGTNSINNQRVLESGDFIFVGNGNTLNNAGIMSPGGDQAIQHTTLTGNFTQADNAYAFWRFDIGSSGKADMFAISGTARLGSSFNQVDISLMGLPASVGTYTLVTASSGLTGTFALRSLNEPAMPSGLTFGLVNTDTEEQLTLSASVGNFYWRGANGTNWNTAFNSGSSVWSSDVDGTFIFGTPGAGSDVFFAATNAPSATYATVLGADFAVNSLTFLSPDPMSIGGGNSLTIVAANGTGISVNPGSGPVTISANIALGGSQTWINNSSSLFSVTGPSISGSGNNLTIDGTGDTQISAANQTGSGAVKKTGSGTLTLSGTSTFTSGVSVNDGTLLMNGSLQNSAVTVRSGATLGGTGTITGAVSILAGGSLSAGNSPGTLTVGSLSLDAGSSLNFELGVPGEVGQEYPPGNDLVNVTGALVLAGTVNVSQLANFGAGSYRLFNYGSLTNNGVTVNITPGASNLAAQVVTGVTGQVNLLVLNATLIGITQFWDGAHTDNSTIEGGSWSWDNFNHNWTNEAGVNNVAWQNGVAYFGGQAGTITLVDTVNPQGLVFATSGYVINGSEGFTLNLVGPTPAPTITVSSNMVATINANITGSNGLTVDGAGTLILTGTNTYTGGTMITAGKLVLGDGATPGASLGPDSVTVTSGTFVLNLAGAEVFGNKVTDNSHMLLDGTLGNDYTLFGSLSGSGDMTKEGGNNVTLSGTNTFSGAVTVNSGTLSLQNSAAVADTVAVRVSTPATLSLLDSETVGSLEGDGVVALNAQTLTTGGNDGTTTFSGSISGTGGNLVKEGAGVFTLSGANTYTGTTDVNVGVLAVSGSLSGAGDVTVASKAVLTGEGSVTTAVNHSVFLNGTLNVQSVGSGHPTTFSVTTSGMGALVLGAGGVIAVDLFTGAGLYDNTAVAGASDVLSLTGNLNATGGGTLVIGNPKSMTGFVSGDKWQLVNLNNGAGSITGRLALNDSSLHLSATQAGNFDEATGVYTVVDTRSGLQMAALQGHAVLSTIQNALGDVNGRLFMLRAGGGEEANDGSIASSVDEGVTLGFGDGPEDSPVVGKVLSTRQWEVFTTVNYANISLSGIGTQAGVDAQTWSPSVGIERHLTSCLTVGFAMSYINTHQSYASNLGHLDIQGIALSAYGSYVRGPFWIDLLYSFGALDLDSVRNPGAGLATANGETGSTTNSVQFNTGWNFRFQNNTFVTGPLVGVDYTHVAVSGYTESTGGIAAMAYGRRDFDSLISRIGWSASKMFVTNCGTITPQLRLSYERQNITNNNATSASLVNLPLTATTRSEAPGQDYLLLGTGINFAFGDRFRLLLSYQVQLFRQDIQAHSGAIRFSYSF